MNKQLDLFGNEVEDSNLPKKLRKETLQQTFRKMHGYDNSHTCGECEFCYQDKAYVHKCKKMEFGMNNVKSETDVRLNENSCDLFKERGK